MKEMNAMSEYIERYWRDAKPEDAIKEPPMVARFKDHGYEEWVVGKLIIWDRSVSPWCRDGDYYYDRCQVYDAPDPGEGWRLIDIENEKPEPTDEYLRDGKYWIEKGNPCDFVSYQYYRRRTTPAVTYEPFTWEDREQLRGRWVMWKHENGLMIESQINHLNEHKDGSLWFKSHDAKWLVENATFLDTGEPVGKKVIE